MLHGSYVRPHRHLTPPKAESFLVLRGHAAAFVFDDNGVVEEARRLSGALRGSRPSVIAVSNELGLGIVPENSLARRFRDLSGIVNREIAGACEEVYFVAAGIPLKMK